MAKFTKENQPAKKGTSSGWFKTKVIASLQRQGYDEDAFIDLLVEKALSEGGVYLSELLKRFSPIPKQSHDAIVISDWPANGTPKEKADCVLKAMANGDMSPDLGHLFIESISKSLGIEEVTELAKRLEVLEEFIRKQKDA